MQLNAIQNSTIHYCKMRYNEIPNIKTKLNTMRYNKIQYNAKLYYAIPYNTTKLNPI